MRLVTAIVFGGAILVSGQVYAQSGASSGQSGDQPGSGSTAIPPGQGMNQPGQGSLEQRSMDMTGGKGGLPAHYDVQAVRRGHLMDEKGGNLDQEVVNAQGEKLGTIQKLIKDTKTGKIEYAVLELADTKYQLPLQWSLFKQQGDKLILKATKNDLRPEGINSNLVKDNSPEISQYMNEINSVRQNPKTGGGLGIQDETNRPASAGSMGEDKAGGGGPSGTPSLPQSGQSPQFEGGNPSSKR
ncbi:MAG TPA: PRC-barrel domain-containing protein [Nitrospiraceae bacterium]|nr:PRC-barrel domain-containing protein [Nitrospiraceae bacterium]